MDRTEAIEHLKVVLKTCDVQDEEAVEMAIATLEGNDIDVPSKWIPVTPNTMPEKNRVVVVCGEKGTWDFGTYRGHCSSIHLWIWKKNTLKTVYWWMYKDDALPPQPKGE
jgi:hypothetical protein